MLRRDGRLATTCAWYLAMLSAIFLGATSAAAQTPPTVTSVRLYIMDCGTLYRQKPAQYTLEQIDNETNFANPCYLIVHPKGTMLWDLGVLPDALVPIHEFPPHRPGASNKVDRTLKSQLAELGYRPADITYVTSSHGHYDHVANANDYTASTWLVQKAEREWMFREEAQKNAVVFATYNRLANAKTVDLTGEHDVFGDGTVVLMPTPGHTPGSQVLLVKLAKTGPVLLAGDLYHFDADRRVEIQPTNERLAQEKASRAGVEKFLKDTGTELWIHHDLPRYRTQKKSPEYYE